VVAAGEEAVSKIGADEAGSARDEDPQFVTSWAGAAMRRRN
jgi:hypothetical protein